MDLTDFAKMMADVGATGLIGMIFYFMLRQFLPKLIETQRAELGDLRKNYVDEIRDIRNHYQICAERQAVAIEKLSDTIDTLQRTCVMAQANAHSICRYEEKK
jgi:hypothetical protein